MPLTLSHPAAVLPLRRLGLPMTALVIGSMVPDVPLYLGSSRGYHLAHSAIGIPTVDLAGALLALVTWFAVLRDPLVDLAPPPVRDRLAPRARLTRRQWWLAPIGALVGAASHVAWDSFTHVDRWGSNHVAWLRAEHGGLAGLQWAQYVSGVVGLLVVGLFAIAQLRRSPVRAGHRPPRILPASALVAVLLLGGLAGAAAAVAHASVGLHAMAYHAVVSSIVVCVVGAGLVCAVWQARRLHREESVREA